MEKDFTERVIAKVAGAICDRLFQSGVECLIPGQKCKDGWTRQEAYTAIAQVMREIVDKARNEQHDSQRPQDI